MGWIVVVLAVAFGQVGLLAEIVTPSSSTTVGNPSQEANRAAAYDIITQMSLVNQGFQLMLQQGNLPSQVLFNGASGGLDGTYTAFISDATSQAYYQQIFLSGVGALSNPPAAPVKALAWGMAPASAQYYYRNNMAFKGGASAVPLDLGTAAPEIAMFYPNISAGVCLSINATLYKDSETDPTQIPASGLASTAFTGTSTTSVSMTTANGSALARQTGCVATTDTQYVAFQALAVQ